MTNNITLPFSELKQIALLGHTVHNDKFFLEIKDRVRSDWFQVRTAPIVYQEKLNFFKKHGRCPTVMELKNCEAFMLAEAPIRFAINDLFLKIEQILPEFSVEALRTELTEWLHVEMFKEGMRQSQKVFSESHPAKSFEIMRKTLREIEDTTFEEIKEVDFDNILQVLHKNEEEYKDALTTGLAGFDKLLNPKCEDGALLLGDTSVVMGPVNTGKSLHLITIICANLKKNKYVLWMTHEGRDADLIEKILSCYLEITTSQLFQLYKTERGREVIEETGKKINKYLTYIHLSKAGLTVEEVMSVIRKKQEKLTLKRGNGRGFDLLVDDYPATLLTSSLSSSAPKREKDMHVYTIFVQLAEEYKFHNLLAIQTNREGAKINKGISEERLLTKEDVAESYGPMHKATNVWTINRDPVAVANNRVTFYIDKSRSSETGFAVVCRSNYSNSITHSEALGYTWYRGTSNYTDKIDQLLKQYNKTGIEDSVILGTNI